MTRGQCCTCCRDVELDGDNRPISHRMRLQYEDCQGGWCDGRLWCYGSKARDIYESTMDSKIGTKASGGASIMGKVLTDQEAMEIRKEYREFVEYEEGIAGRPKTEHAAIRNLRKRWRNFRKWRKEHR